MAVIETEGGAAARVSGRWQAGLGATSTDAVEAGALSVSSRTSLFDLRRR